MKKIVKISGVILLCIILLMVALPFIFKDKIIAKVKTEANKNLNATLNFTDLSLSLFTNFPQFSITLDNLSLANAAPFKGDTLISAKSFRVTTDILSVISGDAIKINSIFIDKARINAIVLKDGKANWDITKPSASATTTAEEPSAFKATLQKYSITNSFIKYDDKSMDFSTVINGLNHSGKGDFTADVTNLDTETSIDSMDLTYGAIKYFNKVKLDYKAAFNLDIKNSKYTFKENELQLNQLFLKFAGFVSMPKEDIEMDITFSALKNDVKNFISIVPGTFTKDFEQVKSSGKMAFDGFVKGIYNEKSIPGFALNLLIENGMIQYPGLPRAINNMQVNTKITCPGVDANKTVINVSKLHVDLGQFPIDAHMLVKTPITDPDIDGHVKGNLDLATMKDLLPLEKGTSLAGKIAADITFKGKMSAIEKEKYEEFYAAGMASVSSLIYISKDLPQNVNVSAAEMKFSPKSLDLTKFAMTLGKSDINANGSLTNYLAYALKNEKIGGILNVNSRYLDLNPFMTEAPASAATSNPEPAPAPGDVSGYVRIPSNIDFTLNSNIDKLIYDNMTMTAVNGQLKVQDQTVKLNNLSMNTLGGNMLLNGTYNTSSEQGPFVSMGMNVKDFNIKQTAKTFNTVKKLAPIAENTTGTISSVLNFSGQADKAFNFIYPTLNGEGKFNSSVIEIEGFEMVKKIAETLKIDKLKKWKLDKLSGSFVITKGQISIAPFETKIGNYKATIAGTNGLDQSINYAINIDVPRSEFGGAANGVLNGLVSQANKNGFKSELGDNIPVAINVTGTFSNPKIKTDLKQQANNAMDDLKKQAEQKAREELERKKKELLDQANAEKDKYKKEAEAKLKAEQDRLKAEADKVKAEAERKAKEEADKLKNKAKDEIGKGVKDLFKKK